MARTSSLNCLSCRNPYQTPHSLNPSPLFTENPFLFTKKCFVGSPAQKSAPILGTDTPNLTLESASPSPPQGSIWHRHRVKSGNRCRIDAKLGSLRRGGRGGFEGKVRTACASLRYYLERILRDRGGGGISHWAANSMLNERKVDNFGLIFVPWWKKNAWDFQAKSGTSASCPLFSGRVRPRQGTEICNFGAPSPLEARRWILCFFSSIYVQFRKRSPLKSGESSEKSSGENRVKSCHVCGCHGFLGPDFPSFPNENRSSRIMSGKR